MANQDRFDASSIASQAFENIDHQEVNQEEGMKLYTPREVYSYLEDRVIGQAKAKRALAIAVLNHTKRLIAHFNEINEVDPSMTPFQGKWECLKDVTLDKSNILMAGPTGTGKTYLIKNVCKMLDVPCYIADCTKLTESGFVGADVESVLSGLLHEADGNLAKAQCGIVILDEIDKLGRRGENPSLTRDVGGEGVQQGLLKIVEGTKVAVSPAGGRIHPEQKLLDFDTTNVLFIGLGAFVGLDKIIEKRLTKGSGIGYANLGSKKIDSNEETDWLDYVTQEDLKKFGLIPELIGRFPVLTHTTQLSEEDLVRILTEPKNSIVKQYQKLMLMEFRELEFTKEALLLIAHVAVKTNTGARGLRSILENVLEPLMFDCGWEKESEEYEQLLVTEEHVRESLSRNYAEFLD